MNFDQSSKAAEIKREKKINGLLYGILAAAGYSIATWGIDAFQLASSHAALPLIKLLYGSILVFLIFSFVGWLTARLDKSLLGLIFWIFAGFGVGWLTAHMPYAGFAPSLMKIIDSSLQGTSYPFTDTAATRMLIIVFIVVVAAAVVGALEMPLVDSATGALSSIGRLVTLSLCIVILGIAGAGANSLANELTSDPIVAINDIITFSQRSLGTQVDPKTARDMHLRSLDPIKNLLDQPRRLAIGGYDDTIITVKVLIDFNGQWAACTVVNGQPSYCEPVAAPHSDAPQSSVSGMPVAQASGQDTAVPPGSLSTTPGAVSITKPFATSAVTSPQPAVKTVSPNSTTALTAQTPLLPEAQASLPDLSSAPQYTITLNVNYDQHTFSGHEVLAYTNAENTSLDRIYLRLIPNGHKSYGNGSLAVSNLTLDGQAAQTQLSLEDSVLEVKLPTPLASGQKALLEMDFTGVVPVDFGGDITPEGYGIYNLSSGVLAMANWYPILAVYDEQGWNLDPVSGLGDSVYSDIAFYNVGIQAPQKVTIAATGVAQEQQEEGELRHYHYLSGPARDFFVIMSPDFQVASQVVDGTTINSYALPGQNKGGTAALSVAAGALKNYNQDFGAYPYSELDVVEAPMRNASGVEFPGIVLIGRFLYNKSSDPTFTITVAHEVAHQWWYNIVGNNIFKDPWLDEGLTTYSSGIYAEAEGGRQAAQGLLNYWQDRYQQAVEKGKDDAITQSLAHFESLNDPGVYGSIVYSKSALFFNDLRQEIGDQAFFTGLQNYYQNYKYKIARPDDLLDAFETASGRQLDDFYHKWLATPGS